MTNGSAYPTVKINFDRNLTKVVNPFNFIVRDINVTDVNGTLGGMELDQNATYIYARTHAQRARYVGNSGKAFIYYEAYCSDVGCDKTLLPNSTASVYTDDPRWFVNPSHISNIGDVGAIAQKGANYITADNITGVNPTTVDLTYDHEDRGYPYKATMQNSASSWLIYNPYNPNATSNEFEVEFSKNGDWIGKHETNTTTKQNASDKMNRRSMW